MLLPSHSPSWILKLGALRPGPWLPQQATLQEPLPLSPKLAVPVCSLGCAYFRQGPYTTLLAHLVHATLTPLLTSRVSYVTQAVTLCSGQFPSRGAGTTVDNSRCRSTQGWSYKLSNLKMKSQC